MKGTYHAFPVNEDEVRVAVVVISDAGKLVFDFDKDSEMAEIDKNVDYVTFPGGDRNVGSAISVAIRNVLASTGRRGMVPQVLVTILAGKSSDDIAVMTKELHRAGIKSIAVGLGSVVNRDELSLVAGDPQNVIVNSDLSKLATVVPNVVEQINRGKASLNGRFLHFEGTFEQNIRSLITFLLYILVQMRLDFHLHFILTWFENTSDNMKH